MNDAQPDYPSCPVCGNRIRYLGFVVKDVIVYPDAKCAGGHSIEYDDIVQGRIEEYRWQEGSWIIVQNTNNAT